jgi:hypothetical protein
MNRVNPNNCMQYVFSVAPLEEVDYTSHDQLNLQGHGDTGAVGVDAPSASSMATSDLHRQLLNIPMTSEGSHDSHNDSGYSTRLGFSAGPSPSLSGTWKRPLH